MNSKQPIASVDDLEDQLSTPPGYVVDALSRIHGDIIILGVAGKMGPTLARMAKRATDLAGTKRRVIGVSRFSKASEQQALEQFSIETIKCDLLDTASLNALPDCPNVIYMAGMKFGSTGNESLTWGMNTFLPGMVCQKFRGSRIVAFSTGNVYGLVPIAGGGSIESDSLNPAGEYAMSCLGRERIFEHFSRTLNIPVSIIRLNYACELRYGVLVDLAQRIFKGEPIDLAMGNFNVIWQADANAMSIAALGHATSPAFPLNVSGTETLSVRRTCEQLAMRMNKTVSFSGKEADTALLNNAQLSHQLFGYPRVGAGQLIDWIANWVNGGGTTSGKPTHFEARDGKF